MTATDIPPASGPCPCADDVLSFQPYTERIHMLMSEVVDVALKSDTACPLGHLFLFAQVWTEEHWKAADRACQILGIDVPEHKYGVDPPSSRRVR
jgi:hypothetical protein